MKSVPIISIALTLCLIVPALAKSAPSGGMQYWPADESVFNESYATTRTVSKTKVQSYTKNDRRKLAFLMPMAPPRSPVPPPKGAVKLKASVSNEPNRSAVPANLDQAAETCVSMVEDLGKLSTDKALEVGRWVGLFIKQMNNSTPVATPIGVYTPTKSQKHLFLTREGRLKTVVAE